MVTSSDIDDLSIRNDREIVEVDTNRIFEIGDICVLSELKELIRTFGLRWNFVSSRSGKYISYNHASRK